MRKVEHVNKLKFFIVDDDYFSRMLYRQHLINLGYKDNILFDNGYDCIKKLDMCPDIIFLDYDMKPFNGLDVLQLVKQYNPDITLLVISGHDDAQVAIDAMNLGAYDFIKKGDSDLEKISQIVSLIASKKAS